MKLLLAICFFSFVSFGQLNANESIGAGEITSIGMQRLNLEKSIRYKISSVLDSIITKDAYTIDILMEIAAPERPSWYTRDGSAGKAAKAKKAKVKAAAAAAAEAAAKKIEQKDENKQDENQGKIRFVEDTLPVDEGNVIVFDKLGIEAPLIDDFNDFQPDGKIIFTMGTNQASKQKKDEQEKQDAKAAAKVAAAKVAADTAAAASAAKEPKVAFLDQMWKFQKAVDIFNNLQRVELVVALSSSLTPEVRSKIEGYIKKINFNLGGVKPKVQFNYILLGKDLKKADWGSKLWKIFELLSKYATFLGLVLSMLIFAFIGNKLIEKYFSMVSDESSSDTMNIEMTAPEKEEDENSMPEGAGAGGGGEATGAGIVGFDGLRRFREYSEISSAEAIILIKRWIAEFTDAGQKSLKALVQRMEVQELEKIFTELATSEKKRWQALMNEPLSAQDLAMANDYISNQIVQNIILPSFMDDKEVFAMIYQLTPEQVVKLIAKNKKAGAALINVLNTTFVMDVFKKCPSDMKIGLVNQAMRLKPEDIKASQDDLKFELTKFINKQAEVPFFDKIALLIPTSVEIGFEKHLYELLAKEKAYGIAKELSAKYFPASLIPSMPEVMVKELLQNYPLQDKVNLFLTLEDDLRDELMAIFAPAGTKAHDMLHMEFENIKADETEYERVKSSKDEYWRDFVAYVRTKVKGNKLYANQTQSIVNEWIEGIFNSGSRANLKAA